MSEILRRHALSGSFLLLVLGYFLLRGEGNELYRFAGATMGTSYSVQLTELPAGKPEAELAAEIDALLTRLDRDIFSTYAADSELSRLNRHPTGEPFTASPELFTVIELARTISGRTDGVFDITVAPLVDLWGFGPQLSAERRVPAASRIESALEEIGYEHLWMEASSRQIIKTRALQIDLSAIAKGYAVDELARYFDELGSESYFLEIGGELKIKGLKPGGLSWVPAIEAPLNTAPQVYDIFFSRGETLGVAGSGDYRNYFEQDGVRYSHEIDPRTGYPISHNLAAAYVIDDSTAVADALATAYMVLGLDRSIELAEQAGQAAYFIYKSDGGEFASYVTASFERFLETEA